MSLADKSCVPCRKGESPLSESQMAPLLKQLSGWQVSRSLDGGTAEMDVLKKRFQFRDFRAAMVFLRKVEEIAEREGHHPDFCVHYNKVDFSIWTHAIGGLHENDFILAAKIDRAASKAE